MMQPFPAIRPVQQALIRIARPRRLGSLFIPQRRRYYVTMPLMLITCALLCWATGSDFAMIVGAVVLGLVSLYLMFDLLARRAPLRVSLVLAITLGLAYGLGTANTWFTLPRGDESLGAFMHIDPSDLAYAMASILTSIAMLIGLGELFEQPIFGEEFLLAFNNRAIIFLTLGAAVLGISFLRGSTGFMGTAQASEGADYGHLGYLAGLAEWLSGSLLALSVCVTLNIKGRFLRIYTRLLTVVLFVMVFPLGRRVMIFTIVLSLIGLRLGRYQFPFSPLKKIVLLGLLAGGLYFASMGFYYLRIAGYGLVHPTLVQRIEAAIQLSKDRDYSDIKQEVAKNVQTRTFILGFVGELQGYTHGAPNAYGTDIAKQFQLSLPSLLYPDKDLFFTEEALANQLFGAHYIDEANSIYSAGSIDFGIWGILFYPLIAVLLVRSFFEAIAELMPVFASCFVILASFSIILEPENNADVYFLVIRNGIIFGSVVWFVMALPEFRLRGGGN